MTDYNASVVDVAQVSTTSKSSLKVKTASHENRFLSTAEAARMLGLSTTLVQTLVDQGDLKGWKTRGGHRRISMDSIMDYQSASRHIVGSNHKHFSKPKVSVVIDSPHLFEEIRQDYASWNLGIDVHF